MVFSVIGGDERMIFLADKLRECGHKVRMCGFERHPRHIPCVSAGDALFGAEYVILPIPSTKDGITVWMPYGENEVHLSDMAGAAGGKTVFFTAGVTLGARREFDYFAREELAVLNAVPTVEGAIGTALSSTPHTLWRSRCLSVGFGRIGKLLCHRLSSFGCSVAASSRRAEVQSWIEAYGYEHVASSMLSKRAAEYDIIFNTVPSQLLTEEVLKTLRPETLIIELASPPYGVDFEAAKRLGINAVLASGLPAKTAPKTAADIIFDTISNILSEQH